MPDERFDSEETYALLDEIAGQASAIVSLQASHLPGKHPLPKEFAIFTRECTDWYRKANLETVVILEGETELIRGPFESAQKLVLNVLADPAPHYANNFASLDLAARRIQQGIDALYRLPGRGRPSIPGWPRNAFQLD